MFIIVTQKLNSNPDKVSHDKKKKKKIQNKKITRQTVSKAGTTMVHRGREMRVSEVDVPSDRNKTFPQQIRILFNIPKVHPPSPGSPCRQQQKCPATCFLFFSKRIRRHFKTRSQSVRVKRCPR